MKGVIISAFRTSGVNSFYAQLINNETVKIFSKLTPLNAFCTIPIEGSCQTTPIWKGLIPQSNEHYKGG